MLSSEGLFKNKFGGSRLYRIGNLSVVPRRRGSPAARRKRAGAGKSNLLKIVAGNTVKSAMPASTALADWPRQFGLSNAGACRRHRHFAMVHQENRCRPAASVGDEHLSRTRSAKAITAGGSRSYCIAPRPAAMIEEHRLPLQDEWRAEKMMPRAAKQTGRDLPRPRARLEA